MTAYSPVNRTPGSSTIPRAFAALTVPAVVPRAERITRRTAHRNPLSEVLRARRQSRLFTAATTSGSIALLAFLGALASGALV